MTADAWATALFVMGPERARQIAHEREDLSVILLEPNAKGMTTVWVEEDLQPRFNLEPSAKKNHVVRYF